MRQSIEPFTLLAQETGTLGVYPALTLSDSFRAQRHYHLTAVSIMAAISNPGIPPMGIFLVVGRDDPTFSASLVGNIVAQLFAGNASTDKSEWLDFGDYFVDVPSGCPLSLYSCGGVVNPAQPLIGVCTVHLVPVP